MTSRLNSENENTHSTLPGEMMTGFQLGCQAFGKGKGDSSYLLGKQSNERESNNGEFHDDIELFKGKESSKEVCWVKKKVNAKAGESNQSMENERGGEELEGESCRRQYSA